jgi:PIN domain nuclease of toxin-antitoxin system
VESIAIVIVLDTHVLVWFAEDNPRLSTRGTRVADAALHRNGLIVSAISFWEIAMLIKKRRLTLRLSPAAFPRESPRTGAP